MDGTRHVLIVGGSDAGKSNFIFRLWLAILGQSGFLQADGVPVDIEYLESGATKLLSGTYAQHTPRTVHNQNIIHVKNTSNGNNFHGALIVPDYSGEEWQSIYNKREWSEQWESYIAHQCSSLLFIRVDSDQYVNPLDWITCEKLFGSPPYSPISSRNSQQHKSSTQVVLVDWLQCLDRAYRELIGGSFRPRVGIVITAWDLVPDDQQATSPQTYLHINYPMLSEFIETNKDRFDFEIFGASIAGGDLKGNVSFRKEYLDGNPQKAGYVIHALSGKIEKSPDFTLPIAWSLGLTANCGKEGLPAS